MTVRSLVSEVTNRIAARNFEFQVFFDVKRHALCHLLDSFSTPLGLWTRIMHPADLRYQKSANLK